jgi:hypothetical protein
MNVMIKLLSLFGNRADSFPHSFGARNKGIPLPASQNPTNADPLFSAAVWAEDALYVSGCASKVAAGLARAEWCFGELVPRIPMALVGRQCLLVTRSTRSRIKCYTANVDLLIIG